MLRQTPVPHLAISTVPRAVPPISSSPFPISRAGHPQPYRLTICHSHLQTAGQSIHGNCRCRSWRSCWLRPLPNKKRSETLSPPILALSHIGSPSSLATGACRRSARLRPPSRCLRRPECRVGPVNWTIACYLLAVPVLHDGDVGADASSPTDVRAFCSELLEETTEGAHVLTTPNSLNGIQVSVSPPSSSLRQVLEGLVGVYQREGPEGKKPRATPKEKQSLVKKEGKIIFRN